MNSSAKVPSIYVAITNHGFGHATRTAAVMAELQRRSPQIRLVFATTAPRWLLDAYVSGPYEYRPVALDVGVVQSDSLTMDLAATQRQLRQLRDRHTDLVAQESRWIRQENIDLVFADCPPLAAPIARAAGIPCWMASNFGWDFIYRAWTEQPGGEGFADLCDWMADCYRDCDRLFRLPFHEPMTVFCQSESSRGETGVEDVGFTGGDPAHDPVLLAQKLGLGAEAARSWDLDQRDRTVLLTFGGLSLQRIPYERLAAFPDWQFFTFDRQAPALPNLLRLNDPAFASLRLRPVDLMPLCRCVLSKPGYSTFSEACRQGTPIIALRRSGFAEAPILEAQMPQVVPHRLIEPAEFFEGDWQFLRQPLEPALGAGGAALGGARALGDGNGAIAQAMLNFF